MIGKNVRVTVGQEALGPGVYPASGPQGPALAWLPAGWQGKLNGLAAAQVEVAGTQYVLCAPYGASVIEPEILQALPQAHVRFCLFEKSCGAVVFYQQDGPARYLLIKNRRGNWGFPKGHVELGETELETARREILEETGLCAEFVPGFRQSVHYYVEEKGVYKTAVYFTAQVHETQVRLPEGEIGAYRLLEWDEACRQLTYPFDRELLKQAHAFLFGQKTR